MQQTDSQKLFVKAWEVLKANDRGGWSVPSGELYPHQWLWDSCFIAIGLRHIDVGRARAELENLLRGQWANGMLPHIIFSNGPYHREYNLWQSWLNPHAPGGVITSGLTQPPMLAEAVLQVGKQMKLPERRSWYRQMLPHIVRYHQWFYRNRDTGDGLIALLHPYESGLDDSPPWASEMRRYAWPWWLNIIARLKLDALVDLVRRDTQYIPAEQRMSNVEAIAYWSLLRKLRHKAYDSKDILKKPVLAVEDLTFNCIFIRANGCLREMAKATGAALPKKLLEDMAKTEAGLEHLWDGHSGQYFSGNLVSGELVMEPSIAALMPLYAGCVPKERADILVGLLRRRGQFASRWPVPSTPQSSDYFNPLRYWQGPTWANTNWLVVEGLRRYGYDQEAEALKEKTLELVAKNGFAEYFSPLDGSAAGAPNFSWTAALTLDFLKN